MSSADMRGIFHWNSAIESLKVVFINMFELLMISGKLGALGSLTRNNLYDTICMIRLI